MPATRPDAVPGSHPVMTQSPPTRHRTPASRPDQWRRCVASVQRLRSGSWAGRSRTSLLARFGVTAAIVMGVSGASLPLATAPAAATTSSTTLVPSYRMVASDGGIFDFGGTTFGGSMGGHPLNKPMVGMASTPTGQGYWTVASDGGIFSFGNAQFYGSMGGTPLNKPIVGMASTPDGKGYWEVASDGGIFSFGNAQFYGSMGGKPLNKPIVGMAATPDGKGYWEVASDGGIFSFGDAHFYGSTGGVPLPGPVVGIAATPTGKGYWIVTSTGFVSNFGDAVYYGSAPAHLVEPVVGISASLGTGQLGADPPYPAGSVGYDVSFAQCGSPLPPGPYQIGVVETNGWGDSSPNPCLRQEAAWAGAGLNLYTYLTCNAAPSSTGTTPPGSQPCTYSQGVAEATYAYDTAEAAGVDVSVPWWLDVEGQNWSTSTSANQQLVAGALAGLRALGLLHVGIYASPGVWTSIVGAWEPQVPYWAADWAGTAPSTICTTVNGNPNYPVLPGPVVMTQYSSPQSPYSYDGMDYTSFDNDYAC